MEFLYEVFGTNTFLTYTAKSGEMDEFSRKMLENNEIEGILPISFIQENLTVKIRYNVTSYETLESYIRRPLPLPKILKLLKSVSSSALELERHMLYPGGIILEPEHMFTEIGTGYTRLVYLPLERDKNADVFMFLRSLLGRIQYENPESAVSILKITNDINGGRITGLGQLLDAIKDAETDRVKLPPAAGRAAEPKPPVLESPKAREEPATAPTVPEEPLPVKNRKPFAFANAEKKQKKKIRQPSVPGFAVPGLEPAPPDLDKSGPSVKEPAGKKGFWGSRKKEKKSEEAVPAAVSIPARPEAAKPDLDFGETVIVRPDDEMTVVSGEGWDSGRGTAYILRRANGQKMYLEKEITKIGRESAYVDFYIGDNLEIGRSHAEFICKGQNYYIKDNHSKNHTYVNNRKLIGDEQAVLNTGDIIGLANEIFEFHAE